jgi:hypothetical protein
MNTETIEAPDLIAIRVPKGDRWKLVDYPDMGIHESLAEALSAYCRQTNFTGSYKLSPLEPQTPKDGSPKGKLYAIKQMVREVVPPPPPEPKGYNIYGEED